MATRSDYSDEELLAKLISFNSVSSRSNLPIADFIADYLDRPNVTVERVFMPGGDKVNLVIRTGPNTGEARAGLSLSAHLDVVPAEEPEWESDPFTLVKKDDKLFGRGTADMKGFVALAVNSIVAASKENLRAPLALILSCDEEVGIRGARHLAENWQPKVSLPKATLVGEPTNQKMVRAHKGMLGTTVSFAGKSAHSGYPHLGVNAIEPAANVVLALSELRRAFEKERCDSSNLFGEVPFVALNVGKIQGGSADNVIPDTCQIAVSVRPLPGMDLVALRDRVNDVIGKAVSGYSQVSTKIEHGHLAPPFKLAETTDAYQMFREVCEPEKTPGVNYATDASWLQELDLDCVICGPGCPAVIHKPNEHLTITEFTAGRDELTKVVNRFTA